jgi:hypothetical protein
MRILMARLKDLQLPRKLNLDILAELLSKKTFESLVYKFADKSLEERRITLPSELCLRKCMVYYLVEKFKGDFSKVINALRSGEKVLAERGHYIGNIKRLYETKKREIENE